MLIHVFQPNKVSTSLSHLCNHLSGPHKHINTQLHLHSLSHPPSHSLLSTLTVIKVKIGIQGAHDQVCRVEGGIRIHNVGAERWVHILRGVLVKVGTVECPGGEVADHLVLAWCGGKDGSE